MNNLNRLKLALSNKKYFTDEEYTVFLSENDLVATEEYVKANEINLYKTVLTILESLANDTDLMRKIDIQDITTTGQASQYLENRIKEVKNKIFDLQNKIEEVPTIVPFLFI